MIAITYLEQKVEQLNLLTWSSLSWKANRSSINKKTPAFYGTLRFIVAFTKVRHQSLY
jgi:hypothetical protein